MNPFRVQNYNFSKLTSNDELGSVSFEENTTKAQSTRNPLASIFSRKRPQFISSNDGPNTSSEKSRSSEFLKLDDMYCVPGKDKFGSGLEGLDSKPNSPHSIPLTLKTPDKQKSCSEAAFSMLSFTPPPSTHSNKISSQGLPETHGSETLANFCLKIIPFIESLGRKEINESYEKKSLENKYRASENNIKSLQVALKEITSRYEVSLIDINSFQKLAKTFHEKNKSISSSLECHSKQMKDLELICEDVKTFKNNILQDYNDLKQESKLSKVKLEANGKELKDLEKKFSESLINLEDKNTQYIALSNQLKALQKTLCEKEDLFSICESELLSKNEELLKDLTALKTHSSTIQESENLLKLENKNLLVEISNLKENSQTLKDHFNKQQLRYDEQLNELGKHNQIKMNDQMEKLKLNQFLIQNLESELENYKVKYESLQADLKASLQEKNAVIYSQQESLLVESQKIDALVLELGQNKAMLSVGLQEKTTELNTLSCKLQSLAEENEALKETILKFTTTERDLQNRAKALDEELSVKKALVCELEGKNATHEQNLIILQNKNEELVNSIKEKDSVSLSESNNREESSNKLQKFQSEYMEMMKVQKLQFDNERRQFENRCKAYEDSLSEIKKENTQLKTSLAEISNNKAQTNIETPLHSKKEMTSIIHNLELDIDKLSHKLNYSPATKNLTSEPSKRLRKAENSTESLSQATIKGNNSKPSNDLDEGGFQPLEKKPPTRKYTGKKIVTDKNPTLKESFKKLIDNPDSDIWSVLDSPR